MQQRGKFYSSLKQVTTTVKRIYGKKKKLFRKLFFSNSSYEYTSHDQNRATKDMLTQMLASHKRDL